MSIYTIDNSGGNFPQDKVFPAALLREVALCADAHHEGLAFPADPNNVFSPLQGKAMVWDSENVEFQAGTGSFFTLKQLFIILAGRFQLSGPLMRMQAEALASCGFNDPEYFQENIRHLGLVKEEVDAAPLIMNDERVVPANGSYLALGSQAGAVDGSLIINALGYSKLLEELPKGIDWHKLTGTQGQGHQLENLQIVLHALEGIGIDQKFFINEISGQSGQTMKSLRNVIRRLEGLGLVEYQQYHGGYAFKPEVWEEVQMLKSNWQQLHTGETVFIGNRPMPLANEDPEHYRLRLVKSEGIVSAYNDFVASRNLANGEAVSFTATDFIIYIRKHAAYSRLGIEPKDLQAFLGRLADPLRGADFIEEEFDDRQDAYLYTKKQYLTTCRRVISVSENQSLLFRRNDFRSLPQNWQEFIHNLDTDEHFDEAHRLVMHLFENAGRYISREDLNRSMQQLGINIHKKSFHSRYFDALDPELNLVGFISIPSKAARYQLDRILHAFTSASEYTSFLAQNEHLMREMFEMNVLPDYHREKGPDIGYHSLRENAAKVLVDYLLRYRQEQNS